MPNILTWKSWKASYCGLKIFGQNQANYLDNILSVHAGTLSESIFGYKDLQIKLYYTAGRLNTYLGMEYKSQVDPKKFDGATVLIFTW